MKVTTVVGLVIALVIGLILGWLIWGREPATDTTGPALGVLATQVGQLKSASSNCWWCGDYLCIDAPEDSAYSIGDRERICGPRSNPRWSNGCPTTTTLGDGSVWQFRENCKCDG
jgi:hypothetical protein